MYLLKNPQYITARLPHHSKPIYIYILLDFSLTVKVATLIFISGCGSAVSSAKEGNIRFNS